MTEDERIAWHYRPSGHEFKQTPGVGDGQGSLACYSPWGRRQLQGFSSCGFSFLVLSCSTLILE